MHKRTTKRLGLALTTAVLVSGMVACKSDNPRRLSLDETTEAELRDGRQLPTSMVEFQEAAANDILQQLPTMPIISQMDGRSTILLGDVQNKTGNVSTAEYESIVSGIRSRLIRSSASKTKLRFVMKRARVENLAANERVATDPAPPQAGSEEIRWGGGQYYVPDYKAANTLGMYMDVTRIGRSTTNQYSIEVMLVSLATNEIVHSFRVDTKQTTR